MVSGERTFIRRPQGNWQCVLCRAIWFLLPVGFIVIGISAVERFRQSAPAEILKPLVISSQWGIYFLLAFLALIIIGIQLCFHDWITRGGKERLTVSTEGIRRISKLPWLAFMLDPSENYHGPRQWHISKMSVRKIVVKINEKNADHSLLEIHHSRGIARLFPMEWEYDGTEQPREDFLRGLRRAKQGLSTVNIAQIPLIKELAAHHFSIEYQVVGSKLVQRN